MSRYDFRLEIDVAKCLPRDSDGPQRYQARWFINERHLGNSQWCRLHSAAGEASFLLATHFTLETDESGALPELLQISVVEEPDVPRPREQRTVGLLRVDLNAHLPSPPRPISRQKATLPMSRGPAGQNPVQLRVAVECKASLAVGRAGSASPSNQSNQRTATAPVRKTPTPRPVRCANTSAENVTLATNTSCPAHPPPRTASASTGARRRVDPAGVSTTPQHATFHPSPQSITPRTVPSAALDREATALPSHRCKSPVQAFPKTTVTPEDPRQESSDEVIHAAKRSLLESLAAADTMQHTAPRSTRHERPVNTADSPVVLAERVRVLEADNATLRRGLTTAKDNLRRLTEEERRLQQQVIGHQRTKDFLETEAHGLRQEVDELQRRLADRDSKLASPQLDAAMAEEQRATREMIATTQQMNKDLRSMLNASEAMCTSLKHELGLAQREAIEATQQVTSGVRAAERRAAEAEDRARRATAAVAMGQKELSKLHRYCEEVAGRLNDANQALAEERTRAQQAHRQLEDLRSVALAQTRYTGASSSVGPSRAASTSPSAYSSQRVQSTGTAAPVFSPELVGRGTPLHSASPNVPPPGRSGSLPKHRQSETVRSTSRPPDLHHDTSL